MVKHRYDHVRVLRAAAALHFLVLCFFKHLYVILCGEVVFLQLFLYAGLFFEILVVELFGPLNRLIGYLLVALEFEVDFLLSLMSLSEEHLPSFYVVHGFVVVSHQVPFN